jgi:hypothetical protein
MWRVFDFFKGLASLYIGGVLVALVVTMIIGL